MAAVYVSWTIEMELSGEGNGWTDVTADVRGIGSIRAGYGIRGSSAVDRVASTGTLVFPLNNSEFNSAGKLGYYSPDNANRRAGFDIGIGVRLSITYSAQTYYKWRGTLEEVNPVPGIARERIVACSCVDWMDDAAKYPLTLIPTAFNQRSDQVFTSLLAAVPKRPAAIETDTGVDTYPIVFDTLRDESTRALSALQDLAMSELGYIYIKGDQSQGGTLVFEARNRRPASTSDLFTIDGTMLQDLKLSRARAPLTTEVKVTAHPRAPQGTGVLFTLSGSAPAIAPGNALPLVCQYRDPNTGAFARVGAQDLVALVATTDYQANSAADGSGTDLTGTISVSTAFGGNSAVVTISNPGGVTAYLTQLQIRGKAIPDYQNVILTADDADAQIDFGLNVLNVDMPLQNDPAVATEVGQYLLHVYGTPRTNASACTFLASKSDALTFQALVREISDRIAISEEVSGFAAQSFFINAVDLEIQKGGILWCTWGLAPADATLYWLVEIVGRSELDSTTRLGFGLILGHIDVAHSDAHGDVAHTDAAHDDTHTDDAHQDAHDDVTAHSDASHTDVGHQDVAHTDTAHSDVAHVDSAHVDTAHSDSAHSDTAHTDSHSDVAHSDVAHFDNSSHSDHDDGPAHSDKDLHADSHTDVAHADSHNDVAHADVAHADVAHGDSHSDTAHSDVAHQDVAHVDSAHGDATAHGDVAHADAHTDVAHGDAAHTDVAHGDAAHDDTHGDTAHGDINLWWLPLLLPMVFKVLACIASTRC